MDPHALHRHTVTWVTLGCMFLAAGALAVGLLVIPGDAVSAAIGAVLGAASALIGMGVIGYAIHTSPGARGRIDAHLDAPLSHPGQVTLPHAVRAARERPAPSVFDRWVTPRR